jgi:hypothetical protein
VQLRQKPQGGGRQDAFIAAAIGADFDRRGDESLAGYGHATAPFGWTSKLGRYVMFDKTNVSIIIMSVVNTQLTR